MQRMFSIIKKLETFSAAHRLIKGYEGKCKHLHGHDYMLEITISAEQLDQYDFVMDFDVIKENFNQWIQDHWDHGTLVSEADQALLGFVKKEKQKYFVLAGNKNTTVECLAEFLFEKFTRILEKLDNGSGLRLMEVRVFESQTASATVSL